MNVPQIRLTSLAHGCGCKLAPSVHTTSSKASPNSPLFASRIKFATGTTRQPANKVRFVSQLNGSGVFGPSTHFSKAAVHLGGCKATL